MLQGMNVPYTIAEFGKLHDAYLHQYPNRKRRRDSDKIHRRRGASTNGFRGYTKVPTRFS